MGWLLGSLLFPILLALFGFALQARSWRRQARETILNAAVDASIRVTEDIGRLIDCRLIYQRRFLWSLMRRPTADTTLDIERAQAEYNSAVISWNKEFTRCKTMIDVYFGHKAMTYFENILHKEFVYLGRRMEQVYQRNSIDIDLGEIDQRLNSHGHRCYKYLKGLTNRIKNRDVGSLPVFDTMYVSKPENTSSIYLLKRLFALQE